MQVIRTENDETGQLVYEVDGYPVKVVVEPGHNEDEVFVEVWDEAGCQDRQTRPTDQAESVALRTLHTEYRSDLAEQQAEVVF